MILIDANLLLYAKIDSYPEHRKSHEWLDSVLSSHERCGIPWESVNAFIRIGTNPRIFERPLSLESAWSQVTDWLDLPSVWIPTPLENHRELLEPLIPHAKGAPGLIHDAHLAAIAKAHGLTVFSADGDFSRFPGVSWVNPIIQ